MSKLIPIQKIDHIGVAVTDLQEAVKLYTLLLGRPPVHQEHAVNERVQTALFDLDGVAIELLEATDAESPIAKFITKQGRGGVHHLCLEVEDLQDKLTELLANGFVLLDQTPKKGVDGKWVAFLHPKSTANVLIELSQTVSRSNTTYAS